MTINSVISSRWHLSWQPEDHLPEILWFTLRASSNPHYELRIGRSSNGYALKMPSVAHFVVVPERDEIIIHPAQGATITQLQHLIDNAVIPRALTLDGYLSFHASAVAHQAGSVAFIGDSGAGKSTLARSLMHDGYTVMSDDCLVFSPETDGLEVLFNPGTLRLWDDAVEFLDPNATRYPTHQPGKHGVKTKTRLDSVNRELRSIYLLNPQPADSPVCIDSVSVSERFEALMLSGFRLDLESVNQAAYEFKWLTTLIEQVPVKRLSVPRDFKRLPEVHAALAVDLGFQD